MHHHDGAAQTVRDAVAALTRLNDAVVAALDAAPDRHAAFTAATEWSAALRELHDRIGEIRARYAAQIWQAEQLSLQGLADRIGVSKARASQLVNDARQPKGD